LTTPPAADFSAAHVALARALAERGYATPTPVQAAVLAADATRDLLVSAQTGSGKTVAFGLGLAATLLGEAPRFTGKVGSPLALVVCPTRELAQQVERELAWLYAATGARIATCVGGMDPRREHRALASGVHIVVGTPGRLCDHLARGALDLGAVRGVVLDEADEMLDMGFREDLQRLLDATPAKERRTLLFSATIPDEIAKLARSYQRNALRIATAGERDGHRDIEYHAVTIIPRERDLAVVNLLRYHEAPGALVFCATRDSVTHLAANLGERGFSVVALSGELSQRERNVALQALRDRRARVCVATDVAARGLDLPDLGIVIHADLPQNAQTLVHRSGRTGRAGRRGVAILVVPDRARGHADRMARTAGVQVSWMPPPTVDEITARDRLQLASEILEATAEVTEDDRVIARQLLVARGVEDLVATLVRVRREARPAPEELTPVRGPQLRAPAPMRPQRPERAERPERPERAERPEGGNRGGGEGVWFTVNIGRTKNADPKWIIPLLCRRGEITKSHIGKITVFARETRVEISPEVSERFAVAVAKPDPKDPKIHIEPADAA
jgi:ATP-dependent RNA helicase DeaD